MVSSDVFVAIADLSRVTRAPWTWFLNLSGAAAPSEVAKNSFAN